MIRFDFKPEAANLNDKYVRLEKCVNEMNKTIMYADVEYWENEAIEIIKAIANENRHSIDLMGGGLS